MSPHQKLVQLDEWITGELDKRTIRQTYNGTQQAIAYRRVQQRLRIIIEDVNVIREAFNLEVDR